MKKIIQLITAAGLSLAILSPAIAQMDHSKPMDHGKPASQQEMPMTDGEVRRVDQETGKITIKHGEIKNLDMPPMTMVFTATDKSLLSNVNAGDKVQFTVKNEKGQMLITSLKVVK
ncbi:copper-binding protein [Hydrogenophaga sp.]|jgi:Cu(I)/Ag(I) efflux system protein CusF|uniref:copper-binding protein n=1 Tax=Hydrogenophaga sp. TaxID=1904254 RepID=UPI001AC96B9B|nr:copper-binding protein [Hydrogenophaga sp.]MBN9373594.1 copper-binding protein [Hydrogenophaga sp.]